MFEGEQTTIARLFDFRRAAFARGAGGEVCFRASMTQVCVCPESKQPVAVPEALRQALCKHMD